nr:MULTISPECIES: bifunctional adenosylcobinamide kinase/adenosylcobinamide-phosphate guanylyltransferase [unclassified Fusibacter]
MTLVTGGARSGKSTFAEKLVASFGDNICYIATSIPFDEGMIDRIKKHKEQRPSDWDTLEAYEDIHLHIAKRTGNYDAYILDCITLLVTNLMFKDMPDYDTLDFDGIEGIERMIAEQIDLMVQAMRLADDNVVLVTNEVGLGIVPENKIARVYRDIAGRVNQQLGNLCDDVYLVVCGQAMHIKKGEVIG